MNLKQLIKCGRILLRMLHKCNKIPHLLPCSDCARLGCGSRLAGLDGLVGNSSAGLSASSEDRARARTDPKPAESGQATQAQLNVAFYQLTEYSQEPNCGFSLT